MAEFEQSQASLKQARANRLAIERQLFVAREKERLLKLSERDLARKHVPDSDDLSQAKSALNKKLRSIGDQRETLENQLEVIQTDESVHLDALHVFSNPTKNISRLDDQYPILMLPVRLETRFKEVALDDNDGDGDQQVQPQLWVRVYPDDIAIDTFEPVLAEVEINNAKTYWTSVWKNAGDVGEHRAAWRVLAKSHGAGRANWILKQYSPLNPAEPTPRSVGEHILVITSEQNIVDPEFTAIQVYWRDAWLADGDESKLNTAYTALETKTSIERAKQIHIELAPVNFLSSRSYPEAITTVRVEILQFPAEDQVDSQQQPWMHAAYSRVMPDRFVLLGFNKSGDEFKQTLEVAGNAIPSDLMVGPDPAANINDQIKPDGDEISLPDEMQWMTDFEQAIQKGMGFKVDLDRVQFRRGFDRLFVLGVRISTDIEQSTKDIETLISHHQSSRKGFSILPQGNPTNNSEDDPSGYRWDEDSDLSYDHFFVQDKSDDPDDNDLKKDGRWLADLLGIDRTVLAESPNYFATDQCEARATNRALWPATLGYFMDQMMDPVFDKSTINQTRSFFNEFVSGRGALPAIRVGKQPYGILPATPYSRIDWMRGRDVPGRDPRGADEFASRFNYTQALYNLIKKVDTKWQELEASVAHVANPGSNPQQVLLDIVGLHPASVEYYQRYAETAAQLANRLKFSGLFGQILAAFIAGAYVKSGTDLLATLGVVSKEGGELPDVLEKLFLKSPNLLKGEVIDDKVLSESEPVRIYTEDNRNYVEWLIDAARESHNALRLQAGFVDNKKPTALLYLMLQHALDLSYIDTSLQLHLEANVLTETEFRNAKKPPNFIHVQDQQRDKGSEWQYLYATEPLITSDENLSVGSFIPQILTIRNPYLNVQIEALEHLKSIPTARLERLLAEHVDCCSYRLDAWWLAIVNQQLSTMRFEKNLDDGESKAGSYIGAYGMLENVRSENKNLTPVNLDPEIADIFNKPGQLELLADNKNNGYIHAPSLNHAVTAAVLRNGYLANATPQNPESLSVNLSSRRVRLAMSVVEGIRNGQNLGALLGYYLERGLHDRSALFLDEFIFELRLAFPLAANRLKSTRVEDNNVSIDAVEARNVVDGLALIEQIQKSSQDGYPFGLDSKLPVITDTNQLDAINEEVNNIRNINDAVADLAIAEGVYQAVQGNYDRAAGTMEAFSKGSFPPTPDVVQTPRSGVTLTHRVGLHLRPGDPTNAVYTTPRAKGEPAINNWLMDYLPGLNSVGCMVAFFDHVADTPREEEVTMSALGLLPADIFYLLDMEGSQQMNELDDAIVFHIHNNFTVRPDGAISIEYMRADSGHLSVFELAALIRSMRSLILGCRPIRYTDIRLPNEAKKLDDILLSINTDKVDEVRALLQLELTKLNVFITAFAPLLASDDLEVVATNVIPVIAQRIDQFVESAHGISRFGSIDAGFGFAYEWSSQQFSAMLAKVQSVIDRWPAKLARFDQLIIEYNNLDPATTDNLKFDKLITAARNLSTATITPLPATPDLLRDDLIANLRSQFIAVQTQLENLLTSATDVSSLYGSLVTLQTSISVHDHETIELDDIKRAFVVFARGLADKANSLNENLQNRLDSAAALVADPGAGNKAITSFTNAIRQFLGDQFIVLPEFQLTVEQGEEWQNGFNASDKLSKWLRDVEGLDFPVDEWLYGVARVREKMGFLENTVILSEALAQKELKLVPVQLPVRDNDCWLALKYPELKPGTTEKLEIDEDKLLYTAHYHDTLQATTSGTAQCGLLLDEWTEVIPTLDETTGLTFHYDRPNSEPPQTLLLTTPARFTGNWQWQDLVDTLHDALDMAKTRAVEPEQIDSTSYSRFLPTILSSVTTRAVSASLNYAHNNEIHNLMES